MVAKSGGGIARTLSYQVAGDIATGARIRVLREFEPPPAGPSRCVEHPTHATDRACISRHGDPGVDALPVIHAERALVGSGRTRRA